VATGFASIGGTPEFDHAFERSVRRAPGDPAIGEADKPRVRTSAFTSVMRGERLDRRDLRTSTGRSAARLRAQFAADLVRLRTDAGATLRGVAREAGVDPSFLSAIEHGLREPSLATAAALAAALGADVSFRLYPVTGPRIRDRLQGAMVECMLRDLGGSWEAFPEVAVRRPARGFIDLVLVQRSVVVAAEFHSELRRVEQLVRWSSDKAAALPSSEPWPVWTRDVVPRIERLLVLRSTRHNREVVRAHEHLLRTLYPANPIAARRALAGADPWPGSAIVWATIEHGRARLLDRLPPGVGWSAT
jgi:transcriptional regulator with XRE-family HTH domain